MLSYWTFANHKIFITEEIEMLRTKLTDNEAQRENLNKIRNEESRSDQIGLETLDDDMPDLEAAQVVSRDSSSEVTVNSVPHILGSVQVYLDNMEHLVMLYIY